jgi:intracellular septation protein A
VLAMKDLIYAVKPLVFDSLGVIVFALLMALKTDLLIASGAGTLVALVVVLFEYSQHGRVASLQWISLAMVLVSTAATIYTLDPRYVMAKPSVVYAMIGSAMLRRGWMNRYIPPENLPLVGDLMTCFGMSGRA